MKRSKVFPIVVGAMMVLLCAGGPTPGAGATQAKVVGGNSRIAFARRVGESSPAILTVRPDGTDLDRVLLEVQAETFAIPVWSPDRATLLISNLDRGIDVSPEFLPATVKPDGSDFNIIFAHAEGSDVTYCSTWTADGMRLLCAIGGSQGIRAGVGSIRASDGGDFKRLTTDPYRHSLDIPTDVSPDGTRYVFMRFRPGPHPDRRTQQSALFVGNVDGGGIRQLTPFGLTFPHIEFASAQWSPDGREIVTSTKHGKLVAVRLDGTGIRTIRLAVGTQWYFASEPDWSPDGSRIVFGMFLNGQEDLYTADADGSAVVQITDTAKFENAPDWGPAEA